MTGTELADALRRAAIECEYADPRYLVLMFTPENPPRDGKRLLSAMREIIAALPDELPQPEALQGNFTALEQQLHTRCSIRQAVFAPQERLPVAQAEGRVCAMPTVSCPPAIPIAVSGEVITPAAVRLMERYHVTEVSVLREN